MQTSSVQATSAEGTSPANNPSSESTIDTPQDTADETLCSRAPGNGAREATWKQILAEAETLALKHKDSRPHGARLESAEASSLCPHRKTRPDDGKARPQVLENEPPAARETDRAGDIYMRV